MSEEARLRDDICRWGSILYQRQLAHGSAGNLSMRLKDGTFLVTPTNSCLGFLKPEQISRVSVEGELLDGEPPSKESFFHLAMYQERPKAGAIVHLHSTYAVAVSCLCHASPENVLPPLTAYHVMRVGKLPLVEYYRPGDKALAAAVGQRARDHRSMLLANHGPIVSAGSLDQAVFAYEELEETAKLFFILGDRKTQPLNASAIAEIDAAFPS